MFFPSCHGNCQHVNGKLGLHFSQSEIVYGSHVNTGEVIETVFMSTMSIDEEQLANSDSEADLTNTQEEVSHQVYHTAKTIQKLVANMKPTMPWPPSSDHQKI